MHEEQEIKNSGLVNSSVTGISRSWMEARVFGQPVISFWPLQVSGWLFAMIFPVVIISTETATDSNLMWLSLSRPLSGFLVTLALRPCCSKIFDRCSNPYLLILIIFGSASLVGWAELNAACWVCRLFGFPDLPDQIWVGVLVYRCLTLLLWILLYFGMKSFVCHSEVEREFQRSEIRLLRSQVNPHFLFNALTTIMAVRKNEDQVALVTQSLADYLRFSLSQQEEDLVSHPLSQELDALENYLQVEKIRFQKNFESCIKVSGDARAACVPSALIQPLLENAIKYGQQTSPLPLCITITAEVLDRTLDLTVENTGKWIEPGSACSSGIGIANLKKRLHLLYGQKARLSFDTSGSTVKAHVSLPI